MQNTLTNSFSKLKTCNTVAQITKTCLAQLFLQTGASTILRLGKKKIHLIYKVFLCILALPLIKLVVIK